MFYSQVTTNFVVAGFMLASLLYLKYVYLTLDASWKYRKRKEKNVCTILEIYMVGYSGNWDILGVLKYHTARILIIRVYVCVTISNYIFFALYYRCMSLLMVAP